LLDRISRRRRSSITTTWSRHSLESSRSPATRPMRFATAGRNTASWMSNIRADAKKPFSIDLVSGPESDTGVPASSAHASSSWRAVHSAVGCDSDNYGAKNGEGAGDVEAEPVVRMEMPAVQVRSTPRVGAIRAGSVTCWSQVGEPTSWVTPNSERKGLAAAASANRPRRPWLRGPAITDIKHAPIRGRSALGHCSSAMPGCCSSREFRSTVRTPNGIRR